MLRFTRSMFAVLFLSTTAVTLTSCSAGDMADSDENVDMPTTEEQELTTSCTPDRILANAPAGRRAIIERALRWVRLRIMYSQSASFEGYRRDCSGFCSMSWGLPQPGPWTGLLAPASTRYSHTIGWNDLEVGDALNDPAHHVMIFAGWMNSAHTSMCIIHENRTGTPANIQARTRSTLGGYHPIRFNRNPPGVFEGPPPDPRCPRTGTAQICLDRDTTATCNNGQITTRANCSASQLCSTGGDQPAHCASTSCVSSGTVTPTAHDICLADGRIARCDGHGVQQAPRTCAAGSRCTTRASGSECTAIPPTPTPTPPADGGSGTDSGAMSTPGGDDAGAPPEDAASTPADGSATASDASAGGPTTTDDGGVASRSDGAARDGATRGGCEAGHRTADGGCDEDNTVYGGMSCAARPGVPTSGGLAALALALAATLGFSRSRGAQGIRRARS